MTNRCEVCGGRDADTELGWTICAGCFRIDAPRRVYGYGPWELVAYLTFWLALAAAVLFIGAAVGHLS